MRFALPSLRTPSPPPKETTLKDLRALLSNNKYDAMHALARDVYWGRGNTETASLRMAVDAALAAVLPDILDKIDQLVAAVDRVRELTQAQLTPFVEVDDVLRALDGVD